MESHPTLLRKATRQLSKLRVGLSGPAGSGKTYSALLIAKGLANDMSKVAIVDTENGSADLYSHLGEYNVLTLTAPYSPERYIAAMNECINAGMEVIIVDSVSHEWEGKGGVLEINELIAQTKFRGNSWAAWSETTPRHQKFIERIVTAPCHMITTARSKTDTIQTEDKKIKKVGLKEIQREGFEYELTCNFTIDREKHYAMSSKDRTGMYIDLDPFVLTEETGKELKKWAETGVAPIAPPVISNTLPVDPIVENKRKINILLQEIIGFKPATAEQAQQAVQNATGLNLLTPDVDLSEIVTRLEITLRDVRKARAGTQTPPSPAVDTGAVDDALVPAMDEEGGDITPSSADKVPAKKKATKSK